MGQEELEKAYLSAALRLMPTGFVWPTDDPDSDMVKIWSGLTRELARWHMRTDHLREEADPATAMELLADWERVVGLPGDTVSVRRVTISASNPDPALRPGGELAVRRVAEPNSFGPDGAREETLGEGDDTYVTYVQEPGASTARPLVIDDAITPDYEVAFPTVPEGQVLVLGDNRPGSCDAHVWIERDAEFTPMDNVIGQAELIYWPIQRVRFLD